MHGGNYWCCVDLDGTSPKTTETESSVALPTRRPPCDNNGDRRGLRDQYQPYVIPSSVPPIADHGSKRQHGRTEEPDIHPFGIANYSSVWFSLLRPALLSKVVIRVGLFSTKTPTGTPTGDASCELL